MTKEAYKKFSYIKHDVPKKKPEMKKLYLKLEKKKKNKEQKINKTHNYTKGD